MIKFKIDNIVQDDQYYEEIFPGIWLMDDHKWAFWAWLNHFTQHTTEFPAKLFHFDYHWDAANDFQDQALTSDFVNMSLSEMHQLLSEDLICKDGFIAPAIINGYFNEIHFYCKQENPQIGFSDEFLNTYRAKQYIYNEISVINEAAKKIPYAFDLDIDLFNESGMYLESKLWTETQLYDFFYICRSLIKNASVVTVAMSFGYSGTEEDTKRLAQYVISKILNIRIDLV